MDEDNAVGVALLKIGWRDEEANVEADADQPERGGGTPRNHPPASGWKACGDEYLNQLM